MNKLQEYAVGTRSFLNEVQVELKKCNWPTRTELLEHTGIVLLAVGIFAAVVALSDTVLYGLMRVLI
jgi:preprotein translocase subunit SecE